MRERERQKGDQPHPFLRHTLLRQWPNSHKDGMSPPLITDIWYSTRRKFNTWLLEDMFRPQHWLFEIWRFLLTLPSSSVTISSTPSFQTSLVIPYALTRLSISWLPTPSCSSMSPDLPSDVPLFFKSHFWTCGSFPWLPTSIQLVSPFWCSLGCAALAIGT